jgi:hypothetical protein
MCVCMLNEIEKVVCLYLLIDLFLLLLKDNMWIIIKIIKKNKRKKKEIIRKNKCILVLQRFFAYKYWSYSTRVSSSKASKTKNKINKKKNIFCSAYSLFSFYLKKKKEKTKFKFQKAKHSNYA